MQIEKIAIVHLHCAALQLDALSKRTMGYARPLAYLMHYKWLVAVG